MYFVWHSLHLHLTMIISPRFLDDETILQCTLNKGHDYSVLCTCATTLHDRWKAGGIWHHRHIFVLDQSPLYCPLPLSHPFLFREYTLAYWLTLTNRLGEKYGAVKLTEVSSWLWIHDIPATYVLYINPHTLQPPDVNTMDRYQIIC